MYVRPTAPRPIGGVLDDAISLYRNAYSKVAGLSFGAAVIVAIPGIFIGLKLAEARSGGPAAILAMMRAPSYWGVNLLTLVLHLGVYGALLTALEKYIESGQAPLGESLGTGVALLPRMLIVTLLFSLMIGIGLVLLVIPGVYLSGLFQLCVVALVVERGGVFEAFGSSRRLVTGHWWRSVGIVTIGFIIVLVFGLIGGFINGVLAAVFGFGSTVALLSQTLIGLAVNVFLLPLLPCFLLAMYHDLKLRHDGADLEARVDALVAQ